ncbi:hybrid PKS-NRPS synthetase pynA-like [Branchiostoma floridae]|uniref:Hybrid PKS-NRPS synthetase pynA-like n=1 Tax=Branchiostoma floridae TaxID=7739 RepID=A0A9J7KYH8_BRAFL|nr:hybrid PKS-NRPS synthetase pynA-like [Branchiostoma floridae]
MPISDMASSDEEQIAIVGLWCRFPNADGPDDFWRVLVNGEDCVEELPPDRRSQGALYDANENTTVTGNSSVERAAVVKGYKEFDPGLFGMTHEEASRMDPQQRFMLECSYKAFENAGITMEDLDGSDTGVFVGATHSDHLSEDDVDPTQAGDPSISGAAASLLAARVSYTFNLTGPALTVDTACSSGLYAVHLGCQAIRTGDCFMAVCGGVSFIRQEKMLEPQYRAGTAGPVGRCKPFSAAAGGYVRGEGCGVVVLKRLQRALEHKDHIWAVIRTGVNQDGRTAIPITAPSQTQQEELLRLVYEHHKIDPQDIDYIEAHGTGTPDWDTVEASSLGNNIGKARKPGDPPVLLGSVKSNIGHLESAAAMAGIIKVLLMMKHEKVVPTLHFHEPNPNIDLDSLRLCVPTEVQDWPLRGKDRRLACVNSFGLNGSNAHAVLEQLQLSRDGSDYEEEETKDTVVALSARKRESLRLAAEDLNDYLRRNPGISVQRLAYTSTMRRTHHDYRLAVYGSSVEDIERSLTKALNEIEDRPETRTERQTSPVSYDFETDKRVIFVFGGQGTLWEGVCLDLMDKESVFRKKLTEIDSLFGQYVDWSLLNKLSNREDFDVPIVAQALIFSTQVALFALWQWWGITPHAILGHSVGEVAAAHCSGVLSLPEAVRVIYHRGRLQNETRAGKMLVVGNLPIEEVEELCKGVSGDLSVAVENSATCCVLSGDRDAIHNIHELLKSMNEENPTRQLFLREVQGVKFAYHSHHMEPVREELQASLADLTGHPPEVELYSTVTGARATPTDFVTGDYWGRNVRQRVMFRSAMSESLRPEKHNVVVGIGPKAPKRSYIKQLAANTKLTYVASVKPNQEYPTMLQGLCELYQAGLLPRWDSLFQGRKYTPYQVPRYHFARRLLWSKTDKTLARRQDLGVKCVSSPTTHPLLTRVSTDPLQYECLISRQKMPYLYDHVQDGTVVVPGAQYCDLGIAACMDVIFPRQPVSSCRTSVTFLTSVTLPSQDGTAVIRVMVNHDEAAKKVHFEQRTDRDVHAKGTVIYSNRQQSTITRLDIDAIRYRCNNTISGDDLYEALQTTGLQYGPTLRRLTECRYGEGTHGKEAMAVIHVHDTVAAEMHSCCIHPAILDCLMQTCFLLEFNILRQTNGRRLKFFPVSIESLVVVRPVEEHMCMYMKQTGGTPGTIRSNGVLVGMDGQVILELRGLTFRMCTDGNSSSLEDFVFTTTWTAAQSQWGGEVEPKLVNEFCELKCLVLQDDCGISNQLEPFVSSDSVFISLEDFKRTDYRNDESAFPKLLQEMDVNLNFDFVLHCCGISQLDPEKLDAEALDTRVELACASLRQVMKMLITDGSRVPVKIITRNVQFSMWQESLDSDVDSAWHGLLDLAGAPLWGLIRCAIREGAYPLLQLVDLSSGNNYEIYTLLHELVARELESYTEIMCVQSVKYYLEIVPSTLRSESTMHRINNAEEGCRLKMQTTGPTKPVNIHAVYSNKHVESQPGHVMVKVQRCHVQPENMYAVTSEAQNGYVIHWSHDADHGWDFLSLDFVGTVVQVTPKCKFRLGDRVIGVFPAVASSVVSLPVSVVQKLSDLPLLQNQPCLSYFVLAWEILVHLLDIKPKQNVCLLEETTGAPSVMARVIEAVALGLKAICYIAQDVYSLSSVRGGVAVVIGGLHAPLRAQLADVIGRNGKVVCLCGQNQQTSASLRIRPDVRVLIVDTSTVFHETNLKMIMPNVSKLLSVQFQRKLNIDLPYTQIPLSSSPHKVGLHDVVTTSRAEIPVVGFGVQSEDGLPGTPVICGRKALFRRDASYVIVDGLTGLGFFTIEFLAERGAGNIVTVSRTQPQADTVTELRRVGEKYGSKIICLVANVTSYKSMTAALDKLRDCLPGIPLKGVFLSTAVSSDRILINQSHAQFKMGLDAKVVGTWNLHLTTRHLNLDYFVCYSSMSSVLGTGGQTSYGAANAFLDGIACLRRQMHMAGQSINWGALQLKTLQRDKRMAKILEQNGIRDLYKDRVSECLENCLLLNPVQLLVVDLDRSRLAAMAKRFPDVRRFEKLVSDIDDVTADDVLLSTAVDLDRLGQMSEQGRREAIGALTRNVFVNLLNAEPGDVHTMQRSVVNMGMDSLLALTAQNIFKNKFQVDVPWIALLGKKSTIESINDQVFEQLNKRISEGQPVAFVGRDVH